jgi:hypothetical protein
MHEEGDTDGVGGFLAGCASSGGDLQQCLAEGGPTSENSKKLERLFLSLA